MKKLLYQTQSKIFEKVVTKNGKLFRICFVILEREGRLRGKVLSCTPIEILSGSTERVCRSYLPIFRRAPAVTDKGLRIKDNILSPFFTLEFFKSQMTRAPSFSF